MSALGLSVIGKVMLGTSLLGCVAGMVGSFAVLRRRALVGDMLAHASLPGLCLAFLVAGSVAPNLGRNYLALTGGALLSGLAGIAGMTLVCRWTRTRQDAAIGIVLSTFFGAGIVLLAFIQGTRIPGKAGLNNLLLGKAAAMLDSDIVMLVVVSSVSLAILTLMYKELLAFSFDPGFTQAQGWPGLLIDFVMMGTLAVVTIAGLPVVGIVLMAALIVVPGAAARFWTERLSRMLLIAAAIGAAMGITGTWLSSRFNLPTGPIIVLCGTTFFVLSMLFAPNRGIVAELTSHFRLRRRTARDHLLRSLYEACEPELPRRPVVSYETLLADRSWSLSQLKQLLIQAQDRGDVVFEPGGPRLTAEGLHRSAEVTRRHRLWELFLIERANIAADHVDRDADDIEHFLSPDLLARLETRLAEAGRLPENWTPGTLPDSPHELPRDAKPSEGR